jgi:limonene-1,2-epoxide hydrolase
MNIRLTLLITIVLISMLGMAGCAAPSTQPDATLVPPTQPPATQVAPAQPPENKATQNAKNNSEIVQKMVERLNTGDVEGSLAYFADDAMGYLMGFPPTGIEIYKGKEQMRALWEDSFANHFKWEVEIRQVSGDRVDVKTKTWHDFTIQLGVAPLEYIDVYEVKDGKIITYGSWLTQESLARFKPAFAEAVPPEPTATPSSDPPVSEMTVTIAEGSCTTDSVVNLKAGEMKVTLKVEDTDNSLYALTLFNLDPGKDILDLMVATVGMPPPWGDMLLEAELGPGQSNTYTVKLEKGPVYLICWSQPPDLPIGNAGPFAVVP